jgi:transposase
MHRNAVEFVNIDLLVPQEHLLRKIDKAVNLSHIYEFVEELYCEDNGRPSVDPVVLFKIVLIQHLYGILFGTGSSICGWDTYQSKRQHQ